MIDNGRIIDTGSLQRLQSRNVYIQSLQATGSSTPQENRDETLQIAQNSHEKVLDLHSKDDELLHDQSSTDHTRQNGDFSVYTYYMSAAGRMPAVLVFVMILCWSFCREFSSKS